VDVVTNKLKIPTVPCLALAVSKDRIALPFVLLDREYNGIMFDPDSDGEMQALNTSLIIVFYNLRSLPRIRIDPNNLTPWTFACLKNLYETGRQVGYYGEIDKYCLKVISS
jgi:hypothetical protein